MLVFSLVLSIAAGVGQIKADDDQRVGRLVLVDNDIIVGECDGSLYKWRIEADRIVRSKLRDITGAKLLAAIAGGQIIVTCGNRRVMILDEKGTLTKTVGELGGSPHMLTVSPKGTLLAYLASTDMAIVWSISNSRELYELKAAEGRKWTSVCLLTEEILVTGNSTGVLWFFDAQSGKPRKQIPTHDGEIRTLAAAPNGQRLASTGADKMLYVFDSAANECLLSVQVATPIVFLAFSEDGARLVSVTEDKKVQVWDMKTRKLASTSSINVSLRAITASRDAKVLYVQDRRNQLAIWDAELGKALRKEIK